MTFRLDFGDKLCSNSSSTLKQCRQDTHHVSGTAPTSTGPLQMSSRFLKAFHPLPPSNKGGLRYDLNKCCKIREKKYVEEDITYSQGIIHRVSFIRIILPII
jgi:hypothetical protein